ncbi:hybrid sensor histidine kinase/response regulator [endosymbiont of unidentified scaly snail isolate Monju]|uniref:hybrid sensor histidine kinase/response regulator n=1 Tax=endosymbiont of unidentified scaly snail isolate Monju TaxID=1248727 RepID=UPI00038927A3|nr:Hpt domain-containing protein [endosymbiont of unidentified scaly snail isolate Monju]BAN69758.1 type IV pili two-component system sensor histidine kinase and response regulator [endosymbiont of unidentified scaly snail isolate Monju]
MTTELSLDHSGLHWIRREVEENLRQARLVLEDFVAGDAEDLAPAIRSLHQVRGALTLTQIHGAAMLADELEWLARGMNEDRVGSREAAAEVLMLGIAQLPAYLDRIESGEPDIPLILLPLMNDLRAAREAPLVSEASLFAPRLDAQLAAEPVEQGSGNPQLPELVAGLRMDYHRALLKWFRDLDTPGGLKVLRGLIDRVSSAAGTARLRRLLDAAEALLVAIAEGSVQTTPAVKLLYGQLDRVFKRMIDQGEEAVAQDFPVELLKNFLYYIARSDSSDPVVLAVRRAADLANSFPDLSEEDLREGRFIGAGRELFESVAQALEEDLQRIKDQLDLYMRGDRHDLERFASLAEPIRRMADTLGMIGQGGLRSRLVPHADMIRDAVEKGEPPDEARLDHLAWDLLSVQSALPTLSEPALSQDEAAADEAIVPEGEYRQYLKVALDQAFVELARIKEALSTYFDTGTVGILDPVPAILHRLSGVFSVLDQQVVGDLFVRLQGYVEALLSGQREAPDAGERDRLGDMISGIEVHRESLLEPSPDRRRALVVAGEAADHLGLAESSCAGERTVAEDPVVAGALEDEAPGAEPSAPVTEATEVTGDDSVSVNAVEQPDQGRAEEGGQADAGVYSSEPVSALADDGSSVLDSEILSIFVEEAREELQTLQAHFPVWREDPADREALTRIRRSFHTLKGSGRLVGALEIGEFAWALENLLNRVIDGTRRADTEVFTIVEEALELLPMLIEARESGSAAVDGVLELQARAESLAAGTPSEEAAAADEPLEEALEQASGFEEEFDVVLEGEVAETEIEVDTEPLILALDEDDDEEEISSLLSAEAEDQEDESILTPTTEERPPIELDETLHQIFVREAENHLATMESFIARCRGIANGCVFNDELRRALHTLRGSAHMAQIASVAGLAGALERWANLRHELAHRTDQAAIDLLERGHFVISALLAVIHVPGAQMPSWQALVQEIELEIEVLEGAEDTGTGAETAQSGDETSPYDEELVAIFVDEARELLDRLESGMADWQARPDDLLPVVHMQRGLHTIKGGARLSGVTAIGDLSHAMESLLESVVDQRVHSTPDIVRLTRQALDVLTAQIEALEQDEAVEVQEALVEHLQAAARGESFALSTQEPGEAGDDRAARLNIEEDASELELLDDTELDSLEQAASGLSQSTLLTDSQLLTDSELLIESDLVSSSSMVAAGDSELLAGVSADSRIIQFPARGRLAEENEPPRRPPPPEEEKSTTSKERVRVRADLLDQMVNNAGEVSIYGARLEQQNKTLGYNLDELAQTIGRLREQLRKLENETEAQILSRHEREHEGELPDGFDPLEMDRYSTIQQLSRALAETTEDLNSLSVTLQEQSRDTDTLLQQQSRVINDLQDGLLRTRMIPVGSRASRLQRVVRQTAETVGKRAELTLTGAAGEMDRAILERMMAPLEHLLRNAVVHGIEAPADREAAGKPPVGKVSLVVSRDGSDVVLEVSDDGRGLDREAIRRKAIERGLLDPEAHIDDDDLDAFILEAGLSTAHEVTQVAGRGVGMDVVVNEVKQLGGTLDIDSQPGSGTRFTIRLPFTLAISDALLVGIDDEVFAVPHGSLAGIARIPRSELEACYRGERATFSYGGHEYTVRYLGRLLGTGSPHLPEGERWMPLLLVHSGEHRMAIQVDRLLDNRQIVVKSLGTQLASIRWFTGGTILADGGIALILDIGALVRMESARQAMPEPLAERDDEAAGVKVMVVDDSITVRKVTSRLLERHNMQVITARDGVDAVTLLQTERPDVMLLDIEMPRMDGFELARHMRSTEALKDIPIIMITSRTGSKHREHAQELGVRHYLGKPYQESELLENIYTVLAEVTS